MNKNLVHIKEFGKEQYVDIFRLADKLADREKIEKPLSEKTILLFFPESSIRTRVTFEKGIRDLGGNTILFPSNALDKREEIEDVVGYLENWVDAMVIRHNDLKLIEKIAKLSHIPVINAMTKENHPCEILSDLYSLSKIREDYLKDHYLFVGAGGNIGNTWRDASDVFGFSITQCCPPGYEIETMTVSYVLDQAISGKDIVCTDSIPEVAKDDFAFFQVNKEKMDKANHGAVLNPCPPFFRGEVVSQDAIASDYFVGYGFKNNLLVVQQAIILYLLDCV